MLRQLNSENYLYSNSNNLYVIAEEVARNLEDFEVNAKRYIENGTATLITQEKLATINNLTEKLNYLN
jgi:hypothetical protein